MDQPASTPEMTAYGPAERELLRALRDFVASDEAARRATGRRMDLGVSDLRATRFVMTACSRGEPVTPRDVARHLGLTTAATTTVLDRLVEAGHVERRPHPTDGRSKVLVVTDHARNEAHDLLADMHEEMRAVAAAVPADARPALLTFFADLTDVMRRHASGQQARAVPEAHAPGSSTPNP
ncbi:MarR family transcriptional regulator [Nocardioides sp. CER19]|uniref:MarR family winged helix-turn-helix transcriptional regulator n=1 Tax=Nocardioides sp. CER19 TaxID=3038538 RepID=UPI002448ED3B|nr:MarR family transcriptional regulator [Nocardioides sp. CER19]MDH2416240.1 MarR family transcriptional regulator [Nocardioides sp. CER19]